MCQIIKDVVDLTLSKLIISPTMKKDIFSFFALTLAVFSFPLSMQAQLTVTPYTGPHSGATLTSFVQSNLAGTGITVSNATYVGD